MNWFQPPPVRSVADAEEWFYGVEAGWHPILRRLVARLLELGWDGHLDCIKEKYGGLRFYTGVGSLEMEEAITAAEVECERTCEQCGAPGELRDEKIDANGTPLWAWMKTLCDEHAREREYLVGTTKLQGDTNA